MNVSSSNIFFFKLVAKQKKKRGMSRSRNLDVAFEANGNKPLPIEFDITLETFKPVGPNGSMFTRFIGNMIGLRLPPYYRTWNDVPSEFKTSLMRRLRVNIYKYLIIYNFCMISDSFSF